MTRQQHYAVVTALRIALLVVIILAWQGAVSAHLFGQTALASPAATWRLTATWFTSGSVWPNIGSTVILLAAGYLIGLVCGVAIGLASGYSQFFNGFFGPVVTIGNAIPRLVLIPFFIVWFGFGMTPGVVITALVVVFLTAISVQTGVQNLHAIYFAHARVLGARRWQIVGSVMLPGVAIWIIASARSAIGLGFQAAVVAEFFGSTTGLGFLINDGEQTFNSTEIFAGVLVTAALAVVLDALLSLADRRVARWGTSA